MAMEPKIKLRTPGDLVEANEWLMNEQRAGKIDPKTADAMNTTLKGSYQLIVKSRLDALKIVIQANVKKITVPDHLLPDFSK